MFCVQLFYELRYSFCLSFFLVHVVLSPSSVLVHLLLVEDGLCEWEETLLHDVLVQFELCVHSFTIVYNLINY